MFIFFFLFFWWVYCMFVWGVHYVVLLLAIEVLLYSVFLGFCVGGSSFALSVLFMFLVVVVCMGGFSISLMVSVVRFFGGDFFFVNFIF